MELIFKERLQPQNIEFNFEELKAEITDKVKQYENLAYTDEQMREAKADRAKLKKLIDALDNARKTVKAECLEPYTKFEAQITELKNLIDKPVMMIDKQVKEYEESLRVEKEQEIIKLFKSMDPPEQMYLARIWNDKWLNATYSMKKITEEIQAGINRFLSEMAIIERLNNPVPARMVYIETMDLAKAMAESDKQDQIEKAKAEAEARRQAERAKEIGKLIEETMTPPVMETKQPERQWVSFRALLSTDEALALRDFFVAKNIKFEPIH